MLKVVLRSGELTKKNDEKKKGTQPCYFWKTINHNPCFLAFPASKLCLVGCSYYSRCTVVWENFKAHAKLRTVKQYLKG